MSAPATRVWKHNPQAISAIARSKGQAPNAHHFLEHRFGHPPPFSNEEYEAARKYWDNKRAEAEEEVLQILQKREDAARQSAAYKQQIVNYYNTSSNNVPQQQQQAPYPGIQGGGVRGASGGPGGNGAQGAGQYNGPGMDMDGPGAGMASDRTRNDAGGVRNAPLRGFLRQ